MTRYPTPLATLEIDENYAKYLTRKPKLPAGPSLSPHWLILGHTITNTWVRALEEDYKTALKRIHILQQRDFIRDVALISRRKVFVKPKWASSLINPGEEWCSLCRRPTLFQRYNLGTHHAWASPGLVYLDNQERCFFCGIRPSYFTDRARLNTHA